MNRDDNRPATAPAQAAGPAQAVGPPPGDDSGLDDGAVGERQVPFFCPYCGEEPLRPAGVGPGAWECTACARGFQLRFAGLVSSDAGVAP